MLYKAIVSVQYHFVIWFFRDIGRVFSTRPGLKELASRKFLSRAKAIKAATTSDKCATCSPMKTACSPVQSNAFENLLLWHPSATLLQKSANRSNGCLDINLTTVNLSSTSGYLRQPRPSPPFFGWEVIYFHNFQKTRLENINEYYTWHYMT